MQYITTVERIGIKEGRSRVLLMMLEMNFGDVPEAYRKLIEEAA